jgi:plasmid maintenance system antidote protein VapI
METQNIEIPMSDSELLATLMTKYKWTQQDLADRLLVHNSQISRVINWKIYLRTATRKKAEELLNKEKA